MSPETRASITNHVIAIKEEEELETLVSVLGDESAQIAADTHTLHNLVHYEQGREHHYPSI